jgi:hypothetical protein
MNALALPIIEERKLISEEARTHIEILTELLRDVDLEKRMETLIKADNYLKRDSIDNECLEDIRLNLEMELMKVRKMIFMVEMASYK